MNIMIGGISLDQYKNTTCSFEELNLVIKNTTFIPYDAFDEYFGISNEGSIVGDLVKGAYRGTKATVKAGIAGTKFAKKQLGLAKNKWEQFKPKLIAMLKEFGMSLQNLWHKFMEYDKKYKELGQKINNVIQFGINQMQVLPQSSLYYHKFNAALLKGMVDLISNWSFFYECIVDGYKGKKSGLFNGRTIPTPTAVADAIKRRNTREVKDLVTDFSTGIAKLNAAGELTIAMVLERLFGWDISRKLNREMRDAAKKNALGLSEFIKAGIMGDEAQHDFGPEDLYGFKRAMVGGNGSYLRLVASFLNNGILEDALKKGGASTKKGTDLMVKEMQKVMQESDVVDRLEQERQSREDQRTARAENSMNKRNNDANNEDDSLFTGGQNFGTTDQLKDNLENGVGKGDSPEYMTTMGEMSELYCKNYVLFVTKLSNTYGNIVRGVLSASYDIISEAENIVSLIENSANRVKN